MGDAHHDNARDYKLAWLQFLGEVRLSAKRAGASLAIETRADAQVRPPATTLPRR